MNKRERMKQFYEAVRRGDLEFDPRTGMVTRKNMGEVVRRYLEQRRKSAGEGDG